MKIEIFGDVTVNGQLIDFEPFDHEQITYNQLRKDDDGFPILILEQKATWYNRHLRLADKGKIFGIRFNGAQRIQDTILGTVWKNSLIQNGKIILEFRLQK